MQTFTGLVVSAFWQNWIYDAYMPVVGIWQTRMNNFTFFFFFITAVTMTFQRFGLSAIWSTAQAQWQWWERVFSVQRTNPIQHSQSCSSLLSLLLTVGEEGYCRAITTTMAPVALTATADWKITSKAVKCDFYTLISCCSSHFTRPASLSYVHSACSLSLPLLFQPFSSSKSTTLIRKKQSWATMRI